MDIKKYWNKSHIKNIYSKSSSYIASIELKFPKESKILDIGGGQGQDAAYLTLKGHIVTIIDISTYAKEKVELTYPKVKFIIHDIANIRYPFKDNSFNIVYSRLTLQYFKPEEMINIYKEINRILSSKGAVYITVKSTKDKQEMIDLKNKSKEISRGVFEDDGIFKTRFTHEQIRQQLNMAGINSFKINEISEPLEKANKYGHNKLLLTEIIFKKTTLQIICFFGY